MSPIYSYKCACGYEFELLQPLSAAREHICGCGEMAERVPGVTVVGHVGLKKEAERIDQRMKYNAARGKRSSSPR